MTTILLSNPDPTIRVLLHPGKSPYMTVEISDTDAIGAPQWELRDNGSTEHVHSVAHLAAVSHVHPEAFAAARDGNPTALGTCEFQGCRYRCSLVADATSEDAAVSVVVERQSLDQAGAPRWDVYRTDSLGSVATPRNAYYQDDQLCRCLFGVTPEE